MVGPEHWDTLLWMHNLAMLDKARGRFDKAEPSFIQTLEVMRRRARPGASAHPDGDRTIWRSSTRPGAGSIWPSPCTARDLAAQKRVDGEQHPAVAGTLASLGLNLISQEKWIDAESSLRECLAIRERAQPELWSTFNARSLLGGSLLGQKKYAEAEPLLLSGFEGMKAREAKVPVKSKDRLPEALGRIIQLYEAVGKVDEAARWRAKLKFSTKTRPDKMPAEELPSDPFAR